MIQKQSRYNMHVKPRRNASTANLFEEENAAGVSMESNAENERDTDAQVLSKRKTPAKRLAREDFLCRKK